MSIKNKLMEYRKELQEEILSLPASMFPKEFQDFIKRGEDMSTITWNKSMIEDPGVPLDTLIDLKVLTEKRIDLYKQGLL